MRVLIDAEELRAANPRPPLLDVRWALGDDRGHERYLEGHLPGAVFVDLDAELADPPSPAAGRHPMPPVQRLQQSARRWGLRDGDPVVVYDASGGTAAARAWWLLRWTGHRDVRVLDGGLAAWTGELSKEIPSPAEGDFVPAPGALPLLDADGAAALARSGLLLDARAAERYRGEVEPIDRVGGHIPGAVSSPTVENVGADGRFLPAERLASRFVELGATEDTGEVGVYCGSGVSGAHQVLALEIAGFSDAALYAGSWSHWTRDESRPVATGPDPQ